MKNNIDKLELVIFSKIRKITNRKLTPKDSNIGRDLNLMKRLDEPAYDRLMKDYKKVLAIIKEDR